MIRALLDWIWQWDRWIGTIDGRVTMRIKHLVHVFGCRIDLHKIVATDPAGQYHTHPARAVRVVWSGGYVEELEDGRCLRREPGYIGVVEKHTSHRIAKLIDGAASYSLWFRMPIKPGTKIELRGEGWPEEHWPGFDHEHCVLVPPDKLWAELLNRAPYSIGRVPGERALQVRVRAFELGWAVVHETPVGKNDSARLYFLLVKESDVTVLALGYDSLEVPFVSS